jgi:molybdopterin-guanine dinucleotide biosynthesis protein A
VTGLVLAGGRGRRMGNVDKGLAPLHDRPLIRWVLQRLAPQVSEILINANRNGDVYRTFGYRVVEDRIGGFAGPLAGLHSGLAEATHELVISVPCDTPFLPQDLVARLSMPLQDNSVDLSVAKTGDQLQSVVCLVRKRLLPHLAAFLESGGRKVDAWFTSLQAIEVPFDDENAFCNINTPEDLTAATIRTGN